MAFDFHTALQALSAQFRLDFALRPVVGVELECYLVSRLNGKLEPFELDDFLTELEFSLRRRGIAPFDVLQERGESQIEVALKPYDRLSELLKHIAQSKDIIREVASAYDRVPLFDAKPFPEIPGNGFHVHVSLVDHTGQNRFFKRNEEITPELKHALGGLIAALPESMCIFAPQPASYARFTGHEPEAPSTVSWGANNRTTALRLPESVSGLRHIEHRVPGMDADPAATIFAILASIHHGIENELTPPPQTHGNAFLPQYGLPVLPRSYDASIAIFKESNILPDYVGEGWAQWVA